MKLLSSPERDRLAEYEQLVRKYHRTLDLVSSKALRDFPRLIEQSLEYARAIEGHAPSRAILDVGSGVGLPGVVIASALPSQPVLMVERRRRRATFLKIVVAHLGLANAEVREEDVRDLAAEMLDTSFVEESSAARTANDIEAVPSSGGSSDETATRRFGVVTAQAVATFRDVYCLTRHLHADVVLLISRKGPDWEVEVQALAEATRSVPAVLGATPLPGSGTLVAIEVPGGLFCPPSG